jgi:hypothetical protein
MNGIYVIRYRWRGRSFHTVVAGVNLEAAVAEFQREFPHVQVEDEHGAATVTGVRAMAGGGGMEVRYG